MTAYTQSGQLVQIAEHREAALWGLVPLMASRTRRCPYPPGARPGPLPAARPLRPDRPEPVQQQAAHCARQALAVYRETAADQYLPIDALTLLARLNREASHHARVESHLADATALLGHTTPPSAKAAIHFEQTTLLREQNSHDQALNVLGVRGTPALHQQPSRPGPGLRRHRPDPARSRTHDRGHRLPHHMAARILRDLS